MNFDQIGDVALKVDSWNPIRDGHDQLIKYIDLSSIDQDTKTIQRNKPIVAKEAPSRARQLIQEGDVLVSTVRPNLNGVAMVDKSLDGATASTGFCVLRPNVKKLDGSYLFHWVKTSEFISDMVRKSTGASYPAVSDRIILESKIPLPPIAEQKRIAAILDKAEAIRSQRRQALEQLDVIAQSIFLEMFGDPATNPKGWERKSIKQIGQVITGNTPSRAQPEFYGNTIEWIKSDNINTPYHYLTEASEGLSKAGQAVARTVPPLSILVTCIAGSPDCIGNVAIANREVAFNQQINALVPLIGDFRFLYAQFLIGKRLVQEASTSSMKGMISKSRFEEIQLIFPQTNLQEAFGKSFEAIAQLKATHRESLAQLDALFASLQHRAFRGEL